jgi:hypothetical protein
MSGESADERDQRDGDQMPATEELEEPSTEKPPGEEPKAEEPASREPSHEAVGIGVVGRPLVEPEPAVDASGESE